ncbi:hypothetical protein ACJW31_02G149400 [Castanea mollissima]
MSSNTSKTFLQFDLFEVSLDLMERELVLLGICQRGFLTGESIGVPIQGIHPQLKLIQTIIAISSFTLETLTKQTQLNLMEHAITLMLGTIMHREDLRQVEWNRMTSMKAFAQESIQELEISFAPFPMMVFTPLTPLDTLGVFGSSSAKTWWKWMSLLQLNRKSMLLLRNMLQPFQEYHMQHCFRKTNKVALIAKLGLAKLGLGQSKPFISYVTPPFVNLEALSFDCNVVACTRLIQAPIAYD